MATLLHEISRAVRATRLTASGRWHAWRAVRHHDLSRHHRAALHRGADRARELLADR